MKKLFTELDIMNIQHEGKKNVFVDSNTIITPAALDKIRDLGLEILQKKNDPENITTQTATQNSNIKKVIAIGSDHTGFKLKNILSKLLSDNGYKIIDVGTYDEKSCDYPDFALSVALKVKNKVAGFGIILDATGNPSAITANKIHGIRAANCFNEFTAKSSKQHNDANILTMGAKAIGEETAKSILEVWLSSKFEGGRHQRRLNKIIDIEHQN